MPQNSTYQLNEDQIQNDSKFFDDFVNLIPSKHYFEKEFSEDDWPGKKKNKKKSKEELQKLREEQKAKFDPEKQKPVTQLQKEKREKEIQEILENTEVNESPKKTGWLGTLLLSSKQTDPNELKKKLQDKIGELRSKRKATDDGKQATKRRRVESKEKGKK